MEEIMDSLMRCMEVVGSYDGILQIEELYASGESWMLKISRKDEAEKTAAAE